MFSYQDTWWPIFTVTRSARIAFNDLFIKGFKPGIILPDEVLAFSHYFLLKEAVSQGAIPIALYKSSNLNILRLKPHFQLQWVAPNGCFVSTGWDEI